MAILGSSLINYAFKKYYSGVELGRKGYQYNKHALQKLPLPLPENQDNNAITTQIKDIATDILDIHDSNPQKDTKDHESEIDQLVYQLYDLTPEEIAVVEGGQ